MFVLRRFSLLKLTQNNSKILSRQLRRLPREVLKPQISTEHSVQYVDNLPVKQLELRDSASIKNENSNEKFNIDYTKTIANDAVNKENLPERSSTKEEFVPTFNLAAYVQNSRTLQEFLKLGVNLHNIERRKGLAEFVLRLDFENNVKPYLLFLQDQGVSPHVYGELITKNPLLFKVDLDDLQTRVNYLEAKKFTKSQRERIFTLNPFWLMFSTRRIDNRLGYFQKEFKLSGDDIRFLASKQPHLITYNMDNVQKATFCIREEMGFDVDELRCLLLNKPRLWMMNSDMLIERFAFAHNEMQLSHDMLVRFPEVLTSREFRLRQRHDFLKSLGIAQYDPAKDLYVSPKSLVEGNDFHFVRNVAKSDMETYDLFLKTR